MRKKVVRLFEGSFMGTEKAILFTHLPVDLPAATDGSIYTAKMQDALIGRVMPYLISCLKCRNVGLVYIYVDTGLRLALQNLENSNETLKFTLDELDFEQSTRNCIKLAIDEAMLNLSSDPNSQFEEMLSPKFQIVGLPHLISLLRALFKKDPDLIRGLGGQNSFTYDAPKFVEAVIRIKRGSGVPELVRSPIFRIDHDVCVNEKAIDVLIKKAIAAMNNLRRSYSFFSGGYGGSEDKNRNKKDPINDYAVRLHWLVDKKNMELSEDGKHFVRDLGEVGATQVLSDEEMSNAMSCFVNDNRGGKVLNRKSEQVISGAGLFMTRDAIAKLPPFTVYSEMITWIDDHLKRLLHEVLGHLSIDDEEHIKAALFVQDRFPNGFDDKDIKKVKDQYFERILSGCIMQSLIMGGDGKRGAMSEVIHKILEGDGYVFDESRSRDQFYEVGIETARNVLKIWKNAGYGSAILLEWVSEYSSVEILIDDLVQDSIAYIYLVIRWPLYVTAICDLTPVDAYYLFQKPRSVQLKSPERNA
ncbi:hypothetical protein ACFL2V_13670 [Pseudomonadota bacterium]